MGSGTIPEKRLLSREAPDADVPGDCCASEEEEEPKLADENEGLTKY